MKGVSPVSETSTGMFHIAGCTESDRVCTGSLGSALYSTLYFTMGPLTSLHGVSPFHWTEMEEEF